MAEPLTGEQIEERRRNLFWMVNEGMGEADLHDTTLGMQLEWLLTIDAQRTELGTMRGIRAALDAEVTENVRLRKLVEAKNDMLVLLQYDDNGVETPEIQAVIALIEADMETNDGSK